MIWCGTGCWWARVLSHSPPHTYTHPLQAAFFDRIDLSAHGYYAVADDRCGYDWDMQTDKNWERGQPFNYFTQGEIYHMAFISLGSTDRHVHVDMCLYLDPGPSLYQSTLTLHKTNTQARPARRWRWTA